MSIYDAAAWVEPGVGHLPINRAYRGKQLHAVSNEPPIYLVEEFFSAQECREIVEAARGTLRASEVHNASDGGRPARTSWTTELGGGWARAALERAALLTSQPPDKMESPTVSRYLTGQHYVAHHDAFPAGDPLAAPERGGNRVVMVLVHLNDVDSGQGGRTTFHRAGVSVQPKAGRCCLFFPRIPAAV
eukprot:SAG22_NODE_2630_length_2357_cov_1.340567_3_plen_189_part_00